MVPWPRFLELHVGGYLLFWGFHVAGMWALRIAIYPLAGWGSYDYGQIFSRIAMEGLKDVLSFATFALLFYLLEARRARQAREIAAAQLETELREARLQALSAQLDPHFLFNALNTMSAVLYEDLPKTDHLITALGQMLRDGLQAEGPTWTLDREWEHLQHYLAFAEARFGDRLLVEQTIDAGLNVVQIPRFALQRLVENALKHNEDTAGRVLHVRISVWREGATAHFTVADDGIGFQPDSGNGLGLENLRRSLALLHGELGRLEIDNAPEGGARVSLLLPLGASHA
jgi:LytS/YehU family sensor histidine kinase